MKRHDGVFLILCMINVRTSNGHKHYLRKNQIKKSQRLYGAGILLYVGHTGFEPVTSTLSR